MIDRANGAGGARTGVLLLNMGGPWTLEDVKPFLLAVFRDREVIRFPGGPALQGIWARLIATLRAPRVRSRYAAIGGGSPLRDWTRRQAAGLAERLDGAPVEPAMRYCEPRAGDAVTRLVDRGSRRLVLLPLYPQECRATTGTSLADARRAIAERCPQIPFVEVRSFFDHPLYVRALAGRVREGLAGLAPERRERAVLLFSAHGVPERLRLDGDPYVDQVRRTVELVVDELDDEVGAHELSFQSRAGPVRWVGPSTEETVERLGRQGAECVLVVPISFVSDHVETLHEINIELSRVAQRSGIAQLARTPSLNDGPLFLEALGAVVERALAGEEGSDA